MSETPDELRARLGALAAAVAKTRHRKSSAEITANIVAAVAFSQALVNAWPTIDALLARLPTAEADADRLADDLTCAQEQWGDEYLWQKWELDSALRLHAEAVAQRKQPMTCDVCWDLAYMRSQLFGGSQADHYRAALKENEGKPGHEAPSEEQP
jgi:hypothetical protein